MFSNSSIVVQGGTLINHSSTKGMDILKEWVATGAFHNSRELYDAPKCHPHTRIAVLDDIMKWVGESESAREDFMLWLFGPAGAGKSAIAKRIAEIAAEMDMLIGTFFFSRTSPTRRTEDRLVATLAYQLAVLFPDIRSYIEDAIERDPVIFHKTILTQINTLLLRPLQSVLSTQTVPSQKLIIIDGLDECNDSQSQVSILEAISRSFFQHDLPIKFLVVSRPEIHLVTLFASSELLKSVHRRLALDDTYRPDEDIRLFFSEKFEHIKLTHPLRSWIPVSWPTEGELETLIAKSSGQFIYASTVVKFVESICHQPTARLNIILGISPPGRLNPFAELDALYNHILSSVDNLHLTLRVLGLYVMTPQFADALHNMSPELFLSLDPGDIQVALINLSSILTYHQPSGSVKILHASLADFLSDKRRSTIYYIDMASICTDFVRCILQYIKEPGGIRAGDFELFREVINLVPWIPKGQLQNEILNFDLDAFVNASLRWRYKDFSFKATMPAFQIWNSTFLNDATLEDADKKEALDRIDKSLESRLQTYQSDWRLQLLLTLAVTRDIQYIHRDIPHCKCLDILLEMEDNHNLHLVDQRALDLRHAYIIPPPVLIGMIFRYVDGDTFASAALHCMRFLSSPPKCFEKDKYWTPGMRLVYIEWEHTCYTTLIFLRKLLKRANTFPELVKFIKDHDFHPEVQRCCDAYDVWRTNASILAFLSRANACPNWRIISAIQRSLIITYQQPSEYSRYHKDEREATRHLVRQHLDQCCSNLHYAYR